MKYNESHPYPVDITLSPVFHSFHRFFKITLSYVAFRKELGVILQISYNNFVNYLIEKFKFIQPVSTNISKIFLSHKIHISFSTMYM